MPTRSSPRASGRGYRPPGQRALGVTHPPLMPSVLDQAALEARDGGDLRSVGSVVQILDTDPKDRLAGVHGPRLVSLPGVHGMRRNLPQR
jgi:hypothetical protein